MGDANSGRSSAIGGMQANRASVGSPLTGRPAVRKAPDPNFVADSPSKIAAGQPVEHDRFGIGVVISVEGNPLNLKAIVDFKDGGRKTLLLKFAKIRIVK